MLYLKKKTSCKFCLDGISIKIRCYEKNFPTITTLVVTVISSYFADDGIHSAFTFWTAHCRLVGGLQQKELRENYGGEPVIKRKRWWGTCHRGELDK